MTDVLEDIEIYLEKKEEEEEDGVKLEVEEKKKDENEHLELKSNLIIKLKNFYNNFFHNFLFLPLLNINEIFNLIKEKFNTILSDYSSSFPFEILQELIDNDEKNQKKLIHNDTNNQNLNENYTMLYIKYGKKLLNLRLLYEEKLMELNINCEKLKNIWLNYIEMEIKEYNSLLSTSSSTPFSSNIYNNLIQSSSLRILRLSHRASIALPSSSTFWRNLFSSSLLYSNDPHEAYLSSFRALLTLKDFNSMENKSLAYLFLILLLQLFEGRNERKKGDFDEELELYIDEEDNNEISFSNFYEDDEKIDENKLENDDNDEKNFNIKYKKEIKILNNIYNIKQKKNKQFYSLNFILYQIQYCFNLIWMSGFNSIDGYLSFTVFNCNLLQKILFFLIENLFDCFKINYSDENLDDKNQHLINNLENNDKNIKKFYKIFTYIKQVNYIISYFIFSLTSLLKSYYLQDETSWKLFLDYEEKLKTNSIYTEGIVLEKLFDSEENQKEKVEFSNIILNEKFFLLYNYLIILSNKILSQSFNFISPFSSLSSLDSTHSSNSFSSLSSISTLSSLAFPSTSSSTSTSSSLIEDIPAEDKSFFKKLFNEENLINLSIKFNNKTNSTIIKSINKELHQNIFSNTSTFHQYFSSLSSSTSTGSNQDLFSHSSLNIENYSYFSIFFHFPLLHSIPSTLSSSFSLSNLSFLSLNYRNYYKKILSLYNSKFKKDLEDDHNENMNNKNNKKNIELKNKKDKTKKFFLLIFYYNFFYEISLNFLYNIKKNNKKYLIFYNLKEFFSLFSSYFINYSSISSSEDSEIPGYTDFILEAEGEIYKNRYYSSPSYISEIAASTSSNVAPPPSTDPFSNAPLSSETIPASISESSTSLSYNEKIKEYKENKKRKFLELHNDDKEKLANATLSSSQAISSTIFVKNLSNNVTDESLVSVFSFAGDVLKAKIAIDKKTGIKKVSSIRYMFIYIFRFNFFFFIIIILGYGFGSI